MPRKALPLGTWGKVSRREVRPGRWRALVRFRDFDGETRQVETWGKTGAAAERALISAVTNRSTPSDENLNPDTTIARLAAKWLLDVEAGILASNTKQRYSGIVDEHILKGIGAVRIRDMTVGRE